MIKKLAAATFFLLALSVNAAPFNVEERSQLNTFNVDESNSLNKYSLLSITNEENNYFLFSISVMQKNNWDFRSDIYISSETFEKKLKGDFVGNTLSFTLSNEEYMQVVNSEYFTVKSYLNYEDSFYMTPFRDTIEYKTLYSEIFKEDFLKN